MSLHSSSEPRVSAGSSVSKRRSVARSSSPMLSGLFDDNYGLIHWALRGALLERGARASFGEPRGQTCRLPRESIRSSYYRTCMAARRAAGDTLALSYTFHGETCCTSLLGAHKAAASLGKSPTPRRCSGAWKSRRGSPASPPLGLPGAQGAAARGL